MLKRFLGYIAKEHLFEKGDTVLLAFSGGMDSVAMAELFHLAGCRFAIAHCNFQLRGDESDEDEKFAAGIAFRYCVKFHSERFDTSTYCNQTGMSVQETARKLRYDWFGSLMSAEGYGFCATAHHLNDSIETMFINFLRGTGITGLHGIKPLTGKFIRPLLFAKRVEIEDFVREKALPFREDSSNMSDKYLRNRIRHHIIPLFRELNPGFEDTAARNIDRIRDTEEIFLSYVEDRRANLLSREGEMYKIDISQVKQSKGSRAVLYELLSDFGFNSSVTEDIYNAFNTSSGKQFFSDTHKLIKDREYLIITPKAEEEKELYQIFAGENKDVPFQLNISFRKNENFLRPPAVENIVYLDADKLKFPLTLRSWQKGDYFYPLGLGRKKKLSDFYIDQKFSLPQKEKTMLLLSGGDIVWIVGYRMDHRFRITENTENICIIECGKKLNRYAAFI